ncbi:molybdopterin biosynthesis protein [Actibacterium mucosum KCTC 23349]|uniref:Molybdopterin-synthase adenylyltransferase n=1 Tax=Actibacterium mucosum KCTC 23349 TaxID=1454373 RepID=A0A037ZJS0_9RHOB|nr:molybdopterin-synthase adenylyltransferase MoeB [Actibacterium mucosum]KAJ55076.1 molybdopterin biosynthesis protein [Actibacterium mucosum KCTC 23349]
MMIVFVLAAGLWGLGHLMGTPMRLRWVMIGVLYLAVLVVHAVLPDDNTLRVSIGGNLAGWLVFGAIVVLIVGYRRLLGLLRTKARDEDVLKPRSSTFSASELDRYARHIILREIGGPGQKKLRDAKVLVIGAGGLGSPVLLYLAAAGVGTIGIVDDDVVSLSNLQRQVIHRDNRLDMPKVFSAEATMQEINPHVELRPYNRRLTEADAAELFAEYDLILDGTDNFETRFMVNRMAVAAGTPLIAAAITQWEGQISLYDPARDAPCYQCVFPVAPAPHLAPSCAEAGVVGALPGVVGSMMAMETIKEITGAGQSLRGRMLLYDALYAENRVMNVKRRADCPVCGGV